MQASPAFRPTFSANAIAPGRRPTRDALDFGDRRRRAQIRLLLGLAVCCALATGFAACKKKPEPVPLEVMQRYQAQADRLCRAVVKCIKEDTARRLADQPQRRDMVLARMGQDLCVKNQYQLIGSLSTEPLGAKPADYDDQLYERYGRCVAAIEAAQDCETRRERYFQHPECAGLRSEEPGSPPAADP
ncbi:MAG: hypothetical protein NXI24_08415 [bacterium]|nr:hypothetical protein [bacterium]